MPETVGQGTRRQRDNKRRDAGGGEQRGYLYSAELEAMGVGGEERRDGRLEK